MRLSVTSVVCLLTLVTSNMSYCDAGGSGEGRRRREWMEDAYKTGKPKTGMNSGFANMFDLPREGRPVDFRVPKFPFGGLEDLTDTVHDLIESGTAGKAGYGFALGYCSGFCVKKVAKVGAFFIGGAFVVVQTLAYRGYVKVNQDQLKGDVEVRTTAHAMLTSPPSLSPPPPPHTLPSLLLTGLAGPEQGRARGRHRRRTHVR